jgi:RND superfamily putative drug exporter
MSGTARVAGWSARHPWRAIVGWVLLVAVAVALGQVVGTKQLTDADSAVGLSAPADRALARADFDEPITESLLLQSRSGALDAVDAAAAADDLRRRLAVPEVAGTAEPVTSADGTTVLVQVTLALPDEPSDAAAEAALERVQAAVAAVRGTYPDLRVDQVGELSFEQGLGELYDDDFLRAELLSIPLTLVILLLSFGALLAAAVPVVLALCAVATAVGLGALASQLVPMSETMNSVILLVGLAVGVDYSLFYVRRAREERAAGRDELDALDVAARTSGRAVVVSGVTVAVAMSGMFLSGQAIFASFAVGTILVVSVAVLGSVTVLPAALAVLGRWIDRPRVPLVWRLQARSSGAPRFWPALLRPVLRHPAAALALSVTALLALAAPALGMRTALPSQEDLPRSVPVVQAYDRLVAAFPGEGPEHVVVAWDDAPLDRGLVQAAADGLGGADVTVAADGRTARFSVPVGAPAEDPRARASLEQLRADVPGALPGVRSAVTGPVAGSEDFSAAIGSRLPYVIGFVLVLTLVVLLVAFRSLAVALTAIALNLLSVGAAYGLLVLVFQGTWAQDVLGFRSNGSIVSWLPLFLFVILFGLSMDYHVFVVSRIREAALRGLPVRDAVVHGITSSAGVVTSAALVMVAVFGVFATLTPLDFKQMGVGLAAAILIDATVVRAVLLPSAMVLLGERNWWLPRWLRWLPASASHV